MSEEESLRVCAHHGRSIGCAVDAWLDAVSRCRGKRSLGTANRNKIKYIDHGGAKSGRLRIRQRSIPGFFAMHNADKTHDGWYSVNRASLAPESSFENTSAYSRELLNLDDDFMETLAYGTNTLGVTFKDGSTLEDSFDLVTTDLFSGGAPADYYDYDAFVTPIASPPVSPWAVVGIAAGVLGATAAVIVIVKKRKDKKTE